MLVILNHYLLYTPLSLVPVRVFRRSITVKKVLLFISTGIDSTPPDVLRREPTLTYLKVLESKPVNSNSTTNL